jgi:hypothetical protein
LSILVKDAREIAVWFFKFLQSYSGNIGCSFKFLLKAGLEESIVNAPVVSLQSKNTNNAKSEVRFKNS